MRILHVIQELGTGGAERVAVSVAKGARSAGHEVAAAGAPGAFAKEVPGDVFELPLVRRSIRRVPLAVRAVRHAIRAWRPDLLHCHNPTMALVASIATRRGRMVPGLITLQGVPDEDYAATARVLRLAGFPVVACGPGVEQGLLERGLAPVATIVNSVSPPPRPADRAQLERSLPLPPSGPLVVSVGRLVPQKNHALAISAMSQVSDATLVVLGDGPLRSELMERVRDHGLDGRVVLAGVRADARAIVGAADAFLLSSVWEGLPLVALEALAAGTPVVATAVRGVRELLVDGESALLAPPGDAQALGAALARVLADSALAERLSAAGRELVAGYGEQAMVERYLELYEQIVEGRRP
jgi:glycosyltransferase involved in cell wall biosynthesis